MFFFVVFGQHSLTSVERPSYLRSDFVNVWRHARLVYILLRSSTLIWLMIWRFVSRSCLAFSIIPRLIQPRRCYCIRLEMMFKCFASINPLSESRRSFQWMLLSNIPWMAPDGMAFKKNYTNKQKKFKWTAAPSNNFFNILAGIIENYPYGNVCLCRIIMNACNNNKNNNFISVPNIDLHNTKK